MAATRLRVFLLFGLAFLGLTARADQAPATTASPPEGFVHQESDRGPLLLGKVDAAAILAAFPDWPEELDDWQPDSTAVAALATVGSATDIFCVLGTWCGDSRREVPRFWRLLETAGNPNLRLTMVAVGRADDAAANQALADLGLGADYRAEHGIAKVPTFVFRHDGQEIGRIVETPVASLEADAAAILRGAGLIPAAWTDPPPGGDAGWR